MKLKIICFLALLIILPLPVYAGGDSCVNEVVQPNMNTKLTEQKVVIQNWLRATDTSQQLFQKIKATPPCAQCTTDADCILTNKNIGVYLGSLRDNPEFSACCGGPISCGDIDLSSNNYIPLNQEWIAQQKDNYCHTILAPNVAGTKLCPARRACPSRISGNSMFYSAKCVSQRCIKHYSSSP